MTNAEYYGISKIELASKRWRLSKPVPARNNGVQIPAGTEVKARSKYSGLIGVVLPACPHCGAPIHFRVRPDELEEIPVEETPRNVQAKPGEVISGTGGETVRPVSD